MTLYILKHTPESRNLSENILSSLFKNRHIIPSSFVHVIFFFKNRKFLNCCRVGLITPSESGSSCWMAVFA